MTCQLMDPTLAMISETTSQSAGSSELKLGPALASPLACWLRSSSLFWITLLWYMLSARLNK